MSPRPERRKSSLAGLNPIAPASVSEPAQEAVSQPPAPPAPARAVEAPTQAPAARRKYPPKVSIYQDPADTDRMRGAIMATIPWEGVRTLSEFLGSAGMKEVERLEQKYNNGKPFSPVEAREMPQGRPMGE